MYFHLQLRLSDYVHVSEYVLQCIIYFSSSNSVAVHSSQLVIFEYFTSKVRALLEWAVSRFTSGVNRRIFWQVRVSAAPAPSHSSNKVRQKTVRSIFNGFVIVPNALLRVSTIISLCECSIVVNDAAAAD